MGFLERLGAKLRGGKDEWEEFYDAPLGECFRTAASFDGARRAVFAQLSIGTGILLDHLLNPGNPDRLIGVDTGDISISQIRRVLFLLYESQAALFIKSSPSSTEELVDCLKQFPGYQGQPLNVLTKTLEHDELDLAVTGFETWSELSCVFSSDSVSLPITGGMKFVMLLGGAAQSTLESLKAGIGRR